MYENAKRMFKRMLNSGQAGLASWLGIVGNCLGFAASCYCIRNRAHCLIFLPEGNKMRWCNFVLIAIVYLYLLRYLVPMFVPKEKSWQSSGLASQCAKLRVTSLSINRYKHWNHRKQCAYRCNFQCSVNGWNHLYYDYIAKNPQERGDTTPWETNWLTCYRICTRMLSSSLLPLIVLDSFIFWGLLFLFFKDFILPLIEEKLPSGSDLSVGARLDVSCTVTVAKAGNACSRNRIACSNCI